MIRLECKCGFYDMVSTDTMNGTRDPVAMAGRYIHVLPQHIKQGKTKWTVKACRYCKPDLTTAVYPFVDAKTAFKRTEFIRHL
jgi:hypothetical protein